METIATKNPLTNGKIVGTGITNEIYRRQDPAIKRGQPEYVMSRGELCDFAKCPQKWLAGYESDETKATEWGSLIDCLVLTPGRFDLDFAVTPATYKSNGMKCPLCESITDSQKCRKCGTDRHPVTIEKPWDWNANACKEWREGHDGVQVVKHEVNAAALTAVAALRKVPEILALLACSEKQMMVVGEYEDAETGIVVPLKGLIDMVPNTGNEFSNGLADLKTCATAAPHPWTKAVHDRGYDVQAALYIDLFNDATGEERIEFYHALQESELPWQPGKRILSAEFIELGRMKYLDALKRYCACLKSNDWPGYETGKMVLNGWQLCEPLPYMVGA